MKPKVCVLRTDGTNCDKETKYAFEQVGAEAEIVHLKTLIEKHNPATNQKHSLNDYHILALAGGFSHGDYISAGKILALDLKNNLGKEVKQFVMRGKPILGICNGFQVLVKYGLLPQLDGEVKQTTTLTYNDSGNFECRWVKLKKYSDKCIWTQGIDDIDLPIAHGEGKFVADSGLVDRLFEDQLVVFQYTDGEREPVSEFPENPNGSMGSIAGICDPSGLIFGLMPHPERYNDPMNHPLAHSQRVQGTLPAEGAGLQIFRNGVEYVVEKLLG